MTSYCEEQYIHILEKEIREKDAIIDWLAFELETALKLRISAQDLIKLAKEKTNKIKKDKNKEII